MTTLAPNPLPASARCRSVLADGRVLTITASRRPRANRADVKCAAAGAPAIAERMRDVVRLARHTEPRFDSRDQVVLSMDIVPDAAERDWELAAVLADRMVRGVFQPPLAGVAAALADAVNDGLAEGQTDGVANSVPDPVPYAQGWSDHWHLGRVDGGAAGGQALAMARQRPHLGAGRTIIVGGAGPDGVDSGDNVDNPPGVLRIGHLGALVGHADPSSAVSTVRAWFPLHSGGVHDSLAWVEVSVFPIDGPAPADAAGLARSANATHVVAATMEEDTIAAPGLDLAAQQDVRQTLAGARHFDGRGLGRWRSVVRFGQPRFQGGSYQLALVMADRLARGREFVPRGRIIATGCSSAWHAGLVENVEGREPKLALILEQAGAGDRVLLPRDWQALLPPGYAAALRQKGASLACIDRIGMI